jgi:hypothetical protein
VGYRERGTPANGKAACRLAAMLAILDGNQLSYSREQEMLNLENV